MTRRHAAMLRRASRLLAAACSLCCVGLGSSLDGKEAVGTQAMAARAVGTQAAAVQASPPLSASSVTGAYATHVHEAAQRFGLEEGWIRAVMQAESAGQPRAISPVGAMGLMQLMPSTWHYLAARYGLGSDPFESRANILAGAAYLRAMYDRYGDSTSMLAAYNAGPRRVDDWRAGLRNLPPETIAYVARIAPSLQPVARLAVPARSPAPPDWRNAGLFTDAVPASDAAGSQGSEGGTRSTELSAVAEAPAAAQGPARRQAAGLFIPLSGRPGR